jgi:mono/diheme cytochrome c family protein
MRTVQRNRLGTWLTVCCVVVLLLPFTSVFTQPLFNPTKDPLAGSQVFGSKGCAKCHKVNGVGGQGGPDLARVSRPRSFYDLATAMWNHFPTMAEQMRQLGLPPPRLNPRETGDLMAFLFTLNYFETAGDPQAGRQLFIDKRCIICHQVGGAGGVVGPNLDFFKQYGSPIFVATAMWNHSLTMEQIMQDKGIEHPTFTEAELLDLIAYLKSVSKAPAGEPLYVFPGRSYEGRRLFVEKKCSECHGLKEGRWPGQGPGLPARGLHRSLIQFAVAMWDKAPAMMKAMAARKISVPHLRAQEMADIVAYLFSIEYFAKPGDPGKGRALVAAKGCLSCHAVSGTGGNVASDFTQLKGLDSPDIVLSTLWNHSFIMEPIMRQQQLAWPQFRAEEMADLMAFLQAHGETK